MTFSIFNQHDIIEIKFVFSQIKKIEIINMK